MVNLSLLGMGFLEEGEGWFVEGEGDVWNEGTVEKSRCAMKVSQEISLFSS